MRRTTTTALGAAGLVALVTTPFVPASAAENATVSVLHGVPGLTVDVYANGEELIPDFEPGTLTDPLSLPAGTYDLQVFADGDAPDSAEPAIEATGVEVPAGANATVVAHLDADGNPTLTAFVNDTSATAAGEARLTVRHTAAAPAVDVRADGSVLFDGLTNPNEATATSRPAPTAPTSCSPAPRTSRSAPPTSTSPRARTRSSTPGAAPRTATWTSPSRPSTACTPPRAASPAVRQASPPSPAAVPMWALGLGLRH